MVVVPKAQGRGIGRLMMEAVTDQADAEGMNCYLESSRDVPNMQIYERFGFKFAEELECDDDGTAIKLFASKYCNRYFHTFSGFLSESGRIRVVFPRPDPYQMEITPRAPSSTLKSLWSIANSECHLQW